MRIIRCLISKRREPFGFQIQKWAEEKFEFRKNFERFSNRETPSTSKR